MLDVLELSMGMCVNATDYMYALYIEQVFLWCGTDRTGT
jgi:hypothetical protein